MEHSLPGCHQKVGNDYYKYKSIYNYVVQPTKNLTVYIAVRSRLFLIIYLLQPKKLTNRTGKNMDGWNTFSFPFGARPMFRGKLAVSFNGGYILRTWIA